MHQESAQSVIERGGDIKTTFITGIPVNRVFLELYKRPEILGSLGLDTAHKKTLLFTSGGFGLGPTEPIIRSLEKYSDEVQMIIVCGRNVKLKEYLENLKTPLAIKILGFVNYMHKLMAVSDMVITKAGGSTICESLAVGLPMVIFSFIPGQEERNVRLLLKYGAARVIEKPEQITKSINDLLYNPNAMQNWREGIRSIARPFAAKEVVSFVRSFLEMEKKGK
jgi:processive 1,2-diacylglycerol beta-glucosyltransferase